MIVVTFEHRLTGKLFLVKLIVTRVVIDSPRQQLYQFDYNCIKIVSFILDVIIGWNDNIHDPIDC